MSAHLLLLLLATAIDRLIGDPALVWSRVPHPAALFGRLIEAADRRLNDAALPFAERKRRGVVALAALLAVALLAGLALDAAFGFLGWIGFLLEALVASVFLAGRSLELHVRDVAVALRDDGLDAGRRAVAMIVGRDPDALDEPGVCRAAIESLAENASDGLVAPWMAFLLFGLPGLFAYKMVNTADSMIGHMNERYRAFGWAAARLDDLANLAPARLTAVLFALAAPRADGSARRALAAAWRDACLHRSPNAGWPEAAMAGALDLALGGPRRYGDLVVDAPLLHAQGWRNAADEDIDAALALFRRLSNWLIALTLALLLVSFL